MWCSNPAILAKPGVVMLTGNHCMAAHVANWQWVTSLHSAYSLPTGPWVGGTHHIIDLKARWG